MSSPYGHALVGLGLFNLCYPRWATSRKKTGLLYGLIILGACSPDLDFLPGILLGNPSRFHHGPFHSLGTTVGLSLMAGFLLTFWGRNQSFLKTGGFVFILIGSHLFLDYITTTKDLKETYGFPLFWPFSEAYFISSWGFLPYVERNFSNPAIWSQIVRVFAFESLLFIPFFFFSLWVKGRETGNLK